jgi:hypothetical protein
MPRPRSLELAAALVALQALSLAVWGLTELIRALAGHPNDRGTAVLLGAVVLVYAAGVGFAARGLWVMRRWSQTPSYLVSFFAVVIGIGQLHTVPVLAVPLILIGIGSFVALSLPDTRAALGGI